MRPYAGAPQQTQITALDAVRQALQKLFNSSFISTEKVSPSLSPAREKDKDSPFQSASTARADPLCPNVLRAECLLETAEVLYVVLPYSQYSLHDVVSYSPAKLANSHAKVLFILYQVLTALQACHAAGLSVGELSLQDIAVDDQLCSRLRLNLAHYEAAGGGGADRCVTAGRQVPQNILPADAVCVSGDGRALCRDCFDGLKTLVLDWVHGRVSNFCYLMELNRLVGRRAGESR